MKLIFVFGILPNNFFIILLRYFYQFVSIRRHQSPESRNSSSKMSLFECFSKNYQNYIKTNIYKINVSIGQKKIYAIFVFRRMCVFLFITLPSLSVRISSSFSHWVFCSWLSVNWKMKFMHFRIQVWIVHQTATVHFEIRYNCRIYFLLFILSVWNNKFEKKYIFMYRFSENIKFLFCFSDIKELKLIVRWREN